VKLTRR